MNALPALMIGSLITFSCVIVLYFVGRKINHAGIIDVGWAYLIGFLAIFYALVSYGFPARRFLLGVFGGLWGLRLGTYILLDRIIGKPEDPRYVQLKQQWKPFGAVKMFWFYIMQGVVVIWFSLPFLIGSQNIYDTISLVEWLAVALWFLCFMCEWTADIQLSYFKKHNLDKSKTCRIGLWRYSRHPNYFFEFMIWLSLGLFVSESPFGEIAWTCPAAILFFLLKVTGIPKSEEQAIKSRGEDYHRYQQETNRFIPWFPRKPK